MNHKTPDQNLLKLIIVTVIMLLLIPAAYAVSYFVIYHDKNMIISALHFIGAGCITLFSYELTHERFHVN